MVLCGDHDALAARRLDRLAPLVGVELLGVELLGILVARAPLVAGESVHTEVDKGVVLHLHKVELALGRSDVDQALRLRAVLGDVALGVRLAGKRIAVVVVRPALRELLALCVDVVRVGDFVVVVIAFVAVAPRKEAGRAKTDQRDRRNGDCQSLVHNISFICPPWRVFSLQSARSRSMRRRARRTLCSRLCPRPTARHTRV